MVKVNDVSAHADRQHNDCSEEKEFDMIQETYSSGSPIIDIFSSAGRVTRSRIGGKASESASIIVN
jgi:hypothetical protein